MILSIVTPNKNSGRYLSDLMESILAQSIPSGSSLEHIIIDSVSEDNSMSVVEGFKDRYKRANISLKVVSEKDNGQSDAINKGWKLASGKLLTYINSDDWYEIGSISKVIKYFSINKDIDWIYGGWNLVDSNKRVFFSTNPSKFSYRKLLDYCNIGQPSVFMRKDFLDKIGYLNVHYHYAMDYDLWLRAAQINHPGTINQGLSYMRYHTDAKSVKYMQRQIDEMLTINSRYTKPISMGRLRQYFYASIGKLACFLKMDRISRSTQVKG